jgi:AraC-like DNA-binding protein
MELGDAKIGYTAFGTDVRLVAPPIVFDYFVCLPVVGGTQASSRDKTALLTPQYGAVTHPTEALTLEEWSEDCIILGVRLDRAELENQLTGMLGHRVGEPIQFEFGMDLKKGSGAGFLRTVHMLQREAQQPESLGRYNAMAAKLSELLMNALLLTQPHNYSEELRTPVASAHEECIRRVIDFIETSPTEVVSAVQLARIAYLSVRALNEGFKRHVGMPPMTYLREVKLARVRADLLEAEESSTTVAAVANHWGFTHLSRFAGMYRRKYGVLPSVTLRQHHRGLR